MEHRFVFFVFFIPLIIPEPSDLSLWIGRLHLSVTAMYYATNTSLLSIIVWSVTFQPLPREITQN